MRRRRDTCSMASSLFAFQDVMASLIGVLFFIVLFMSLDIVERQIPAAQAGEGAASPQDPLAALKEKLSQLEAEKRALEEQIAGTTEQLNVVSSQSDQELAESIQKLHGRMQYVIEKTRGAGTALAEQEKALAQSRKEIQTRRARLEQLDREIEKLQAQVRAAGNVPRVAYVIDRPPGLEPWLVEVSGGSIRIAPKDGSSSVMSFAAGSDKNRTDQFLSWAKSLDASKYYFVILMKPSGCEQAMSLLQILKKAGYKCGSDLLPEPWRPFAGE